MTTTIAPAGRKKAIVRCIGGRLLRGYLPSTKFVSRLGDQAVLELLELAGRLEQISLPEIETVSFVREFFPGDAVDPERLPRRTFAGKPRGEGLLVRLALSSGVEFEGLASLDTALLDGLTEDLGLQFVPADLRGNTQRIYVPRSAIRSFEAVAVIGSAARKKPADRGLEREQAELFS